MWGSMHLGSTIPLGSFPGSARNGFLWEGDVEWRATQSFSIEGVLGLYDFGSYGAITGLSAYAKLYGTASPAWRWYVAAGPGGFRTPAGGTDLGVSIATGLNRAINSRTEFDVGAVSMRVFDEDVSGLGLRVGVKLSF